MFALPTPGNLNKTLKISTHTEKLNQKYQKVFDLLENQTALCLQKNNEYLHKIKKINSQKKLEFDAIINNLDVIINETRFFKDRIELSENIFIKGFIDKENIQYFEINIKGLPSPVRIIIEVKKGKVETFVSFKNPNPNRAGYEKMYETEVFYIHGKFNTFIEKKCFLGVFAVQASSIAIKYSFSSDNFDKNHHRRSSKKIETHEIEKLQNNPKLRMEFEKRVKKILKKRRQASEINFITANKSFSKNLSSIQLSKKQNLIKKIENVKKKKFLIDEEKIESRKLKMIRKEIREVAEERALKIQGIVFRKEYFEKTWIVLACFVSQMKTLQKKILKIRKERLWLIFIDMQAYKIQKNYKKKFSQGFSFKYRTLAVCKNNLKIFELFSEKVLKTENGHKLINCINEISKHQLIPHKFQKFYLFCIKAQYLWRKYLKKKIFRYKELNSLWTKAADELIQQFSAIKKIKKKKFRGIENIMNIPSTIRSSIINEHLQTCKIDYLNKRRNSINNPKFQYMIDLDTMKSLILSAIKK